MRQLISNVGGDYFALAVTGIIVLLVSLIYRWWNERSEGKLSIPGLSSKDENLGNLGELTKHGGIHEFLLLNHKKFGPMFSFYWGKEFTVSLGAPEVWKDTQTLFDRPINQFELFRPLIGQYTIQYMNTPIGQKHRRLLDRHFSFDTIGSYYTIFNQIGEEMVEKWRTIPRDEHIPLRQHMMKIALKSIIRTSFGEDYFKTNKEILELLKAYNTCWDSMESRMDGTIPDSKEEKEFQTALDLISTKVSQIIQHRKALKDKETRTLLDIMIEADDLYPDDQHIIDMFITFLVGGFHTTGNLLSWMVYYLCVHPEVEKKLLNEIEEVLGDRKFTMEDMDKLSYTRQVIDESMRCSVLGPYGARYSEYDMVIGGHVIPKKTPLIQALGVVLQDEKIWPEPKKFDPDRFLPEKAKQRHPLAFQPFGFSGKRKCPGYRFAYCEAVIFVVVIVRNFKVSIVPGQKAEPLHRFVTQFKEEVFVTVEPR